MKKIAAILTLCIALGTTMCGCGTDSESSSDKDQTQETAQVTESKTETEENPISIGQTVTTDDYELTLESVEWTEEIREQISSNTSWCTKAADNGGEVFLAIKGTFKNLSANEYFIDGIEVTGTVNDKYNLKGSVKSNKFTISPLSTESIYVVIPTSNEMRDAFQNGTVSLNVRETELQDTGGYIKRDTIAKYVLAVSA